VSEARTLDTVTSELMAIAQRCRDRVDRGREWPLADLARLADLVVVIDDGFCRDVADRHEQAPLLAYDAALAEQYERTKQESRVLFEDILAAGFVVEPWLQPGEPYQDSRELRRFVQETRTIRVLLSGDAHGPPGSSGFHPLRHGSGIMVGGVELLHNDLIRTIHDLFGHVMLGTSFGPMGELKAAYCQMALHSDDARAVLFSEQVAQTCWFYFGPHLRDEAGRLRRPGESGYVAPRARPYPEQKVYRTEPGDLSTFRRMFYLTEAS
jgi:hypothetical protein